MLYFRPQLPHIPHRDELEKTFPKYVHCEILCTTLFYICDLRNIPQCVTTKVISRLIFGEVTSPLLTCKIKRTCVTFLTEQKFFYSLDSWNMVILCAFVLYISHLFMSKTVNSSTVFMSNSHCKVVIL